jgi:hypothetical protein
MPRSIDNEVVVLHHGTTVQAASSIIREGWKLVDPTDTIKRVAAAHEVSPVDIVQDLEKNHRFVPGVGREGTVSFAPNRGDAEHAWAQRAPEVELESLYAVHRIKHTGFDDDLVWLSDLTGHAWVWDQMRADQLAVVSYETCYDEMADLGARVPGPRPVPLPTVELLPLAPEIVYDLPFQPDPNRITVTPVARHLPWDIFAHKLGLSAEEFEQRAQNGDFGVPASTGVRCPGIWVTVRPWWTAEHPDLGRCRH